MINENKYISRQIKTDFGFKIKSKRQTCQHCGDLDNSTAT